MTVAAFRISGMGSQQSREIAFQYYDKVSQEVSPGWLAAAVSNNQL